MTHDDSGKDILREHIKSIINETMTSDATDGTTMDEELGVYADALTDGLGIKVMYVSSAQVLFTGAYNRTQA